MIMKSENEKWGPALAHSIFYSVHSFRGKVW
jgi:hypothetical protein